MTDPEENTVAQAAAAIKADREQLAELANRLTNAEVLLDRQAEWRQNVEESLEKLYVRITAMEARAVDVRDIHARLDRQGERVSDLEVTAERHEEWRQNVQVNVESLFTGLSAAQSKISAMEDLVHSAVGDGNEEARVQAAADRERDTAIAQAYFQIGQLTAEVQGIRAQADKYGRDVHPDLTTKNDITRRIINSTLYTVLADTVDFAARNAGLINADTIELFLAKLAEGNVQLVLKVD
jgi:chromosome segregation ATPase